MAYCCPWRGCFRCPPPYDRERSYPVANQQRSSIWQVYKRCKDTSLLYLEKIGLWRSRGRSYFRTKPRLLSLQSAVLRTFLNSRTNEITQTISNGGVAIIWRQCLAAVLHPIPTALVLSIAQRLVIRRQTTLIWLNNWMRRRLELSIVLLLEHKRERNKRTGIWRGSGGHQKE